VRNIQVMKGQR